MGTFQVIFPSFLPVYLRKVLTLHGSSPERVRFTKLLHSCALLLFLKWLLAFGSGYQAYMLKLILPPLKPCCPFSHRITQRSVCACGMQRHTYLPDTYAHAREYEVEEMII